MPVSFARLRIAGFKSFAEPVSVEILPGLTGIVGPNGCGKSNVVEALRWCMGESSARSLRGGEMDDLIFAGTVGRPARSLAEVVLTLEDAAGLAPPPLHDQAELQIGRRIERGSGSFYRINGRDARARDVQTLFADLNSGARASAMVSQGRVAAIVGARPDERRGVLEEAAGITGLHARRHEAELKLRATESNLARAEDLRVQIEQQAGSLAAQAEQARRYRGVAEQLRAGETALIALLHARAHAAVRLTAAARLDAEQLHAAAETSLRRQADTETRLAAAAHAPRENEALARTLLERRRIASERAARDGDRARAESEAAQTRLREALADHDAAESRRDDAEREVGRLDSETEALRTARADLPDRVRAARQALATAEVAVEQADQAQRRDAAAAIAAERRRAEHERDAGAASSRLERASALLAAIDAEINQAEASMPEPSLLAALDAGLADAAQALHATEAGLEQAIAARAAASRLADAAALAAEEAERRHHAARAEETHWADGVEHLDRERAALRTRLADAERQTVPEQEREAARGRVLEAEHALAGAAAALAAAETRRSAAATTRLEAEALRRDGAIASAQAEAERSRVEAALDRAQAEQAQALREHEAAQAAAVDGVALDAATAARIGAEQALAAIGQALEAAEPAIAATQDETAQRTGTLSALRETASRLAAEAEGLAQALSAGAGPTEPAWPKVGELLEVPAGLELAVAAVLADGLEAGCVEQSPQHWRALPVLPDRALPAGATPLDRLVGAPVQLGRALSGAGLIAPGPDGPDGTDGDALQPLLAPGQCLVDANGALWRWDGFTVAAGQPGAASIRLQQRARLRETRIRLDQTNQLLPPAIASLQAAQHRGSEAAAALQILRQRRAEADGDLADRLRDENRLLLADAQNRALLDALAPRVDRAASVLAEALQARQTADAALSALPSQPALDQIADQATRDEIAAGQEEHARRRLRADADAGLQTARADDAALAARHATQEAAQRFLLPALHRLDNEFAAATGALDAARRARDSAAPVEATRQATAHRTEAQAAANAEQDRRTARDAARTGLAALDAERSRINDDRRDGEARLFAVAAQRDAAATEHASARAACDALADAAPGLPDAAAAIATAERSEAALGTAREEERHALQRYTLLSGEQASVEQRQMPLQTALADWRRRLQAAQATWAEAERRSGAAREDARARWLDPDAEAARRAGIETELAQAQREHDGSARLMQAAEEAARLAQARRRENEAALTAARDALLRAEGREEQAGEALARLLADTPEPPTDVPDDLTEAAEATLRRRVAALIREREAIGPVNLRAEGELAEASARMEAIRREREEIETAIARLRGQIGQLNREGRERLLAVFEQVDRHFQSLFARMFNGGRAHLGMVGSDDPLQAGLEIYAQPPGKKLATLSLLSGGEQALTALSLVFAVFRCNPAPICVLDEVDAPLDDANVERFCALLGDMVRDAGTRFLVVTHHQLTMGHMDRLYGVTMQERGVSRVLSVDLAMASSMIG